MTEKKPKPNQKIALERIYRLFELAEKNPERAKRYISLAKRISEKCRARIPPELKQKFCKKCCSVDVTHKKKGEFGIVKCNECKFEKKFGKRPTPRKV